MGFGVQVFVVQGFRVLEVRIEFREVWVQSLGFMFMKGVGSRAVG